MVPLVRTLQKNFPGTKITWVIGRAAYDFLVGLDGVEFIVLDKRRPFSEYLKIYREMRGRRFDLLLATQASWRAHWLYPAINAPVKLGFDRVRSRDCHGLFVNQRIPPAREHLLDGFLSFAKQLGVANPDIEWRLPISSADRQFAAEMIGANTIQRVVAVNPAASKQERNWLPDRYAAVITHLLETGKDKVVLTGGTAPAERLLTEEILALVPRRHEVINLVGRTTPKQLAAVMAMVTVLLAPDTGPVHIATAMGTPVIGMYAVASPELSGPYFSRNLVVNRFPMVLQRHLGKEPAAVPLGTRVRTSNAMSLIAVGDVLEKLAQVKVPQTA
jgi:heptosyltransferase I